MRLSHKASMMFLFSAMLKEQYEDLTKGIIPRVTVFDVKNGIIEFLSHGKFEVRKVKKEELNLPCCPKCGSETYRIYGVNWDWDYMACDKCKYSKKLNEITIEDFDGYWQARKVEE